MAKSRKKAQEEAKIEATLIEEKQKTTENAVKRSIQGADDSKKSDGIEIYNYFSIHGTVAGGFVKAASKLCEDIH